MRTPSAALLWATLLVSGAQATEPPPDLRAAPPQRQVHPSPAPQVASAPAPAAPTASEPRRKREPGDAQVRRHEDEFNRIEEHLDARGHTVRVVVTPKNGAPAYELRPTRATDEQPQVGPRRWKLMDF